MAKWRNGEMDLGLTLTILFIVMFVVIIILILIIHKKNQAYRRLKERYCELEKKYYELRYTSRVQQNSGNVEPKEEPEPEKEKKPNWFKRHKFWTTFIIFYLAFLAVSFLHECGMTGGN